MAHKQHDPQAELARLFDALADSTFELTDEEVFEELLEEGHDATLEVSRLRAGLLQVVKKERLRRAQLQYEAESARLRSERYDLPDSVDERRRLLDAFLATRPEVRSLATAQFRELGELSDTDVEGTLRKLADLGLLDQFLGGRTGE